MAMPERELFGIRREEDLDLLLREPSCNLLVIGGGIHGAAFARLAALNGWKTILLERDDYASATSSRSSKMAHGGLRYLEMFDFQQVFEGIRAREGLFVSAPHLVKPREFMIPVPKGEHLLRWKLAVGLRLYDLFVRKQERRHRWVPARQQRIPLFENRVLKGAFIYYDGLMNDARLVLENILSARRQGALCFNYAEVRQVKQTGGGKVRVEWADRISGKSYETEAAVVVNCAGPWVAEACGTLSAPLSRKIRYSQGTHLLFRRPWNGPALFLPMEGKARYYFVWPHFAGTLVGTTEREIQAPVSQDPFPMKDEIEEVLHRLERDLPGSGLNRERLHYVFAGVRTLPLRGSRKGTVCLSRKHLWIRNGSILSLVGGKFTTAAWTVFEGIKKAAPIVGVSSPRPFRDLPLPGAVGLSEAEASFRKEGERRGISPSILDRAVARLGSRAGDLSGREAAMEVIGGTLLRGEIESAIQEDQAERLEDLMWRRLDLEYADGAGLDLLPEIAKALGKAKPELDPEKEIQNYRDRIGRLWELMGKEL
ncbi:MAG: glycerol-3-phosphate dehydrogenase/oxidase [Deltaproteobacteria bacterium]|nr:glycerol-3-phosphate dehydrogenase/oxidase [Deltaproteobacteria bacterium]